MPEEEFDFEAEFDMLDVGATASMLRTGTVRPSILAFCGASGVEAVALDWSEETGPEPALEDARRFLREVRPAAYALVAHLSRTGRTYSMRLPGSAADVAQEFLGISMLAEDGRGRGLLYSIRRGGSLTFGMPSVIDGASIDWCPIGDVWGNPFCVGDIVKFRARERAIDPSTGLWHAVVELTRMRIHDDQANADEYMSFLDDLRNGIFTVAGRPAGNDAQSRVLLRPRTSFNPLGTLEVEASRILLADRVAAELEQIGDKAVAR